MSTRHLILLAVCVDDGKQGCRSLCSFLVVKTYPVKFMLLLQRGLSTILYRLTLLTQRLTVVTVPSLMVMMPCSSVSVVDSGTGSRGWFDV